MDASGEPVIQQLKGWYDQTDIEPISTEEFWKLCQDLQDFRARYARYWQTVSSTTHSGRPIDGAILPVSPSIALRECEFRYFGRVYQLLRANHLSYFSTRLFGCSERSELSGRHIPRHDGEFRS